LERFILRKASAVVFLCEGARERAIQRTGIDPTKTRVIYPGASPSPDAMQVAYAKGKFCRFAHFGSLGGSRNVKTFLEALQIVFSKHPDLVKTVHFDLYGTMDGLSRNQLAGFNYPDVITDYGKVPRRDALCAMQRSDVLVLIQNRDDLSYETIPSKVYEYLQMRRPVLGLICRNPDLARMLSDHGHFVAEATSVAQIAERITAILGLWQSGELPEPASSPNTVQAATEQLLALSSVFLTKQGSSTGKTPAP
jgi:glycosyltransferase involved in cell wall biosynthesis